MPLASFMAIFRVLDTPEFSLSMVWNLRSFSSYSLQMARLPSVLPSFINKTSISVNVCAATLSRQRRRYRSALYTGTITDNILFSISFLITSKIMNTFYLPISISSYKIFLVPFFLIFSNLLHLFPHLAIIKYQLLSNQNIPSF